ncbi:hypothetical protein, partial [Kingella oralis]
MSTHFQAALGFYRGINPRRMCRFATHRPVCTPIFTSPNIVSGCLFAPPRKPAMLPPHLPHYPAPAK